MILPGVADPAVDAVAGVAAVSEVGELRVVFAAGLAGAEPRAVFAVVSEGAGPRVVFAVLASVADVFEPRASVDIVVLSDVSIPVSVVAVEVDSHVRPTFLVFPNVDYYASSSSSVEVVCRESVHSSTGARANHGFYSILSHPGLHQNRNLEQCYNNPSPGYNNVSDTSDLPTDATTNHSKKTSLYLYQEQHKHHLYQA